VEGIGGALNENRLDFLDELPKILVGLLSAGGLTKLLLQRKVERKPGIAFSVMLGLMIVAAASLALVTYFGLQSVLTRIDREYGTGTGVAFVQVCARRFRELVTLLSALLGLAVTQLRN